MGFAGFTNMGSDTASFLLAVVLVLSREASGLQGFPNQFSAFDGDLATEPLVG